MSTLLLLPSPAPSPDEQSPSDNSGNGNGGGRFDDRDYDSHEHSQPDPDRWATPLSAYRVAMFVGMVWILTLFATLTGVLQSLRVHSTNWVSIPLPHFLYLNTCALVLSSLTLEFARFSLRAKAIQRCARWLFVTVLLGLTFIGGQFITWREFASHGFHLASGAASLCFYLITAAHVVHLLGGVIALSSVTFVVGHLGRKVKSKSALGVIALYWHFMDGLWLYVLTLLFVTIQR